MRILLVNNLFQPEPNHLKGLAFAKALQRAGHDVQVLTGFPNYPGGRLYPGYRQRWTLEEEVEGVTVTRVPAFLSHDTSAVRRVVSYVSLAGAQALHALTSRRRFDVAHVYMGPITLEWAGRVLRARHGTPIVADVQDLWPESVTGSGMLASGMAARVLAAWSRQSYAAADRVVVLSPGYKAALASRGIPEERIEVVYNWCDERFLGSDAAEVPPGVFEDGRFSVVYAGNLGKLQGLDAVLDAAALLRDRAPHVRIVLVGDGVEAERLRRRVADEGLVNVRLTGRVPIDQAGAIQRRADVLLVHLVATPLTRIGIPQKVQACMASGRPILLGAEGDAVALVERARAGISCRPGDGAALAEAIRSFAGMPADRLRELGANGAAFYRSELSFDRGVRRMLDLFDGLAKEGGAR